MNRDIKIVVVEDEESMRRLIHAYLNKMGFKKVFVARDGNEALEKLKEITADLIISDWDMPGMNGIDLLRKVRMDAQYKKTPFLLLTAHRDQESVMEAMKEGVSNYIVKPFERATLEKKLEEILGQ